MLRSILQKMLAKAARDIIRSRRPHVIGITGSVGKTTTKEAIAAVVAARFELRSTYKNYNNEIGLPLTIIGAATPGRSLSGWLAIINQAKRIVRDHSLPYPEMLVLEMGIDHPGDMDILTSIAPPSCAVITRLGTAHVEFFNSLADLHAEKLKLEQALPDDGCFIYNYEDERLRQAGQYSSRRTISYGFTRAADVAAEHLVFNFSDNPGASFKLVYQGSAVPVNIPGIISRPGVLAALAAAAVGFNYGLNAIEISQALRNFQGPAGRMRLLENSFNGILIDDTYNASPEAARESLDTLAEIDRDSYRRSWAVLGDMRELGDESAKAHREIGQYVVDKNIDRLVTVGAEALTIAEEARKQGMEEANIYAFDSSEEAADFLAESVEAGDALLIKGSQAVRLERITKKLLKDPSRADELLVRQSLEWKDA